MTTMVERQPQATPAREEGWAWVRQHEQGGPQEVCAACGALKGVDEGVPYLRKGDARFCTTCWRGLMPADIERVVRAVALRGVPLS
jgi:hypothetical protein